MKIFRFRFEFKQHLGSLGYMPNIYTRPLYTWSFSRLQELDEIVFGGGLDPPYEIAGGIPSYG